MMYIDDAVNATIQIMSADKQFIKNRTSYNLSAISFTVSELADLIKKEFQLWRLVTILISAKKQPSRGQLMTAKLENIGDGNTQ